jgi:hypothetical protein
VSYSPSLHLRLLRGLNNRRFASLELASVQHRHWLVPGCVDEVTVTKMEHSSTLREVPLALLCALLVRYQPLFYDSCTGRLDEISRFSPLLPTGTLLSTEQDKQHLMTQPRPRTPRTPPKHCHSVRSNRELSGLAQYSGRLGVRVTCYLDAHLLTRLPRPATVTNTASTNGLSATAAILDAVSRSNIESRHRAREIRGAETRIPGTGPPDSGANLADLYTRHRRPLKHLL